MVGEGQGWGDGHQGGGGSETYTPTTSRSAPAKYGHFHVQEKKSYCSAQFNRIHRLESDTRPYYMKIHNLDIFLH